ncbi:MAG: TrkH family potassium uptake protein [Candidatus Paracaedibacteraceae bacterium]|nr:TrkH family potassium uptake protein [Candidatus Paracaedibacteraceae bacterium]
MSFRAVLFIIGILLSGLAATMSIPLFVDAFIYNTKDWHSFLIGMCITGFFGSAMALASRPDKKIGLGTREAFITTTLIWIAMCVFAALPIYFSRLHISFVDSCFEAVSALTTTGSTVLVGLDTMPKGLLLWRSILQWLGGVGIVVMAMTIFPALRIGGMQLFRSEFSDRSEKILPRVSQIATAILTTYIFFSILCFILLLLAGMNMFDAVCHTMTSISTGGLSTHDASIAAFNSPLIESILCFFMFIGGSALILYVRLWNGDWKAIKDSQLHVYAWVTLAATIVMTFWYFCTHSHSLMQSFRYCLFSVISVITSTGYTLSDYSLWGPFASLVFFMLSFSGGCTGSTTGGIKIFRFQVLYQLAKSHLHQLRRPYGVYVPMYQNHKITEVIAFSVFTFLILYVVSLVFIALALSAMGLDFLTSLSGAASSLGNVGPGLGSAVGPGTTFASINMGSKIIMMFGMILGRLELLTVLVLFMPSFWRD